MFAACLRIVLAFVIVIGMCYAPVVAHGEPIDLVEAQKKCDQILRHLWARQGGVKRPAIALEPIAVFGKPAQYDIGRNLIVIDPRAYELCLDISHGSDHALAFLIAHEFVHSYQRRFFDYEDLGFFVKSQTLKGWATAQKERRRQMESQADIWGAVLCYLSGYEVADIIPVFIEDLYEAFDLKAEDPLYDSQKERMAIARRAQQEVHQTILLYEMANYMSVLQQHDKDTVLYTYLIDRFKSAEFYNNLGLSYLFLALPKLEEPYRSCPYPLMLDTETRLSRLFKGRVLTPRTLLQKGITQFNHSLTLNADYLPLRINRAAAYHMLSSLEDAKRFAYQKQAREDITFVQRYNLRDYDGSAMSFQHIQTNASRLSAIMANPQLWMEKGGRPRITIPEAEEMYWMIDRVHLPEIARIDQTTYTWTTPVSFSGNISVSGKQFDRSVLTLYHDKSLGKKFYLQRVTQNEAATARVNTAALFPIGTKMPAYALARYRKSIPTVQGDYFLINDEYGMIYKLGRDHIVKEWALFWEG